MLRARGAELKREFAFDVVRQLFDPVLAAASAPEVLAAAGLGEPGELVRGDGWRGIIGVILVLSQDGRLVCRGAHRAR